MKINEQRLLPMWHLEIQRKEHKRLMYIQVEVACR